MATVRALAASLGLLLAAGQAQAQFTKVTDIPLTTVDHHGIAFDGSNWYIAAVLASPTYHVYDPGFGFITDVTVAGVSDDVRGLTFDANSGNLFIGDNDDSTVYEVTVGGSVVQSFMAGTDNLNALAYDPATDTIWLARFDGSVERYGRSGGLISSFSTGFNWTGMALDPGTGNLFLLETNDTIYEYRTDGTQVGQVVDSDQINGNGQGLYFDPTTSELYATSQFEEVALFRLGTGVIPALNPTGLLLLALLLAAAGATGLRLRARAAGRGR